MESLRYVVRVSSGGATTTAAETESYRAALEAAKVANGHRGSSKGCVEVFDAVVDSVVAGYDDKGKFWESQEL